MDLQNPNRPIPDLGALISKLSRAGIEFIIVGGLSAVAQGAPITTLDLDIVHRRTEANISRLMAFLKSVDAHLRRPDDRIIEPTAKDLGAKGHLLLRTTHGPLDVLACIEKGLGFEELVANSTTIDFHGHKIRVLNLETIIELKRGTTDPKDRQRLPIYEETLHLMRRRNRS